MYNRSILMGRLTADPELRQTQSGIPYCKVSIAVDKPAKQGEEKQADFFNLEFWRATAEFVCRYFSKGRMIHVEGKLHNNNYTDQNGVKHYSNVITVEHVAFCGDKSQNAQTAPTQPSGGVYSNQPGNYAPNPASPYNGAQTPQNAYRQNTGYQQYMNAPPVQQYQQPLPGQGYAPRAQAPIELGNLEDFEEVLNDGEVPF